MLLAQTLTEQNLSLGDKVAELTATCNELEALREMSEEMEAQHSQ